MLTRWKLMAGVLGISIGGLAAAASQCSKLDRTKGRSEENPLAKAEVKVSPAGMPSKPELPLPPPPEGPMASVPTVPEPAAPAGPMPPAGPSPAPATPDVLRLPELPEVPTIPTVPEKPAIEAKPTTSANELKPAGASLPTPTPASPTPSANTTEPAIPPIAPADAKTPTPAATPSPVDTPQPATAPPRPSPVAEPTPPKPALTPAAPTEDLIPPVPEPAPRAAATERPASSQAGASAVLPTEPALPVPAAIEKQPQPQRPDAGGATPGMPPASPPLVGGPPAPPVAGEAKFRIILRVGEGEPTFEVKHGDNLILKVASEKVDIKSPEKGAGPSEITARGNVRFVGFGAEGTCEELKFFAGTGQVEMMGDVKVQVKDKLGRVESELTTGSMKYKLDASATGGQLKP